MSQEFTDTVIKSFGSNSTPKARRILGSLIQHIHDFTRENFITTEEWLSAVDFINQIGQMSDIKRNEGILVSDVLGLEALVDTQTHSAEKHDHTSSAIIGPFYRENSPRYKVGESIIQKEVGGIKCYVFGKVTDIYDKPLDNAQVECWQCAPNGLYEQQDPEQPDYNLRGTFTTDDNGYYSYTCLRPTSYPIPYDGPAGLLLQLMDRHPNRPSHIHWRVTKDNYHSLITQIYDSECPYVKDDSVFAVKDDIIVEFKPIDDVPMENLGEEVSSIEDLKDKDIKVYLEYNVKLIEEKELQKSRASIFEKHKQLEKSFTPDDFKRTVSVTKNEVQTIGNLAQAV